MTRKLVLPFSAWSVLLLAASVGCSIYTDDLLKTDDGSSGGSGGDGSNNQGGADTGGTPGAGGGSGGGTGGTDPGSGGQGGSGAGELELIDNMEDGNTTIRFIDKRTGNWDVANGGAGGTQEPAPGFTEMNPDSGEPDSQYAAYTKGEGFSWASLNVSMLNGLVAYDATAYQGLSFKAKVGADSVSTVRVRVVTADTDPKGGVCGTPNPPCYDHFATEIDLSEDWDTHELYFEDFGQLSPAFESVNLSKVYYFEFYFDGASPFELWVDDLSFIQK